MSTHKPLILEAKEHLGLEGSELLAWAVMELVDALYNVADQAEEPAAVLAQALREAARGDRNAMDWLRVCAPDRMPDRGNP